MLVTEIGESYVDRLDKNGELLYSVHVPNVSYPSDAQLLKNGDVLVADYSTPGRIEELTPKGKVVWKYYQASGAGELSKPSLAIPLPNGDVAVNDDYNDRVVIIDPKKNKIVWQYGHTGHSGTAPGYLNVPDGMNFIPATWHLPTA
ncbi:hypothetical protein [Alicyclobacillus herbarius]|uniref:hypothetical protein n=1 Tax=Alicyclobacillus herbarius TaxID=122960 RepID=UPI000418D5A6|nr:hypothetical protein [Alicyclobacillus herbarius]